MFDQVALTLGQGNDHCLHIGLLDDVAEKDFDLHVLTALIDRILNSDSHFNAQAKPNRGGSIGLSGINPDQRARKTIAKKYQ
jgi:hypothetical protein